MTRIPNLPRATKKTNYTKKGSKATPGRLANSSNARGQGMAKTHVGMTGNLATVVVDSTASPIPPTAAAQQFFAWRGRDTTRWQNFSGLECSRGKHLPTRGGHSEHGG